MLTKSIFYGDMSDPVEDGGFFEHYQLFKTMATIITLFTPDFSSQALHPCCHVLPHVTQPCSAVSGATAAFESMKVLETLLLPRFGVSFAVRLWSNVGDLAPVAVAPSCIGTQSSTSTSSSRDSNAELHNTSLAFLRVTSPQSCIEVV